MDLYNGGDKIINYIICYIINISLLLFLTKGNGENQYIIKKNAMKKEMVIEIKLFNFFHYFFFSVYIPLKVTFSKFCILIRLARRFLPVKPACCACEHIVDAKKNWYSDISRRLPPLRADCAFVVVYL